VESLTVARPQFTDSTSPGAVLAAQRAVVIALEAVVSAARDEAARADGALDAALRARDRAVFRYGELIAPIGDATAE